jgi:DNA-binding NtrC family response regulator
MLNHQWPGNVRELSNCLERAMIFIEDDWIDESDLILTQQIPAPDMMEWKVPSTGVVIEDIERQLIVSALEQSGHNKSKAARLLGLTRDTLRYRLEKYDIN